MAEKITFPGKEMTKGSSSESINQLIEDVLRHPTEGLGKPEPLKHELSGAWSRRITEEHRLVHYFDQETVTIMACKHHY